MSIEAVGPDDTEGDVETKVVLPLFTLAEYLGIDLRYIKSKEFLAAFDIGKGAKTRKGYVPDYCIYALSLPVVVVEAKAPGVAVKEGWDEAALYAHAINKRFPSKTNPCEFVFATNGLEFYAGRWDAAVPVVQGPVASLCAGSELLVRLQEFMSFTKIQRYANVISAGFKLLGFKRPANQNNGAALIASKLEPNTFAADLSPILRRYFSSRDQNKDPEIYRNAYVSSNEITSYDKILESFLTDRLSGNYILCKPRQLDVSLCLSSDCKIIWKDSVLSEMIYILHYSIYSLRSS